LEDGPEIKKAVSISTVLIGIVTYNGQSYIALVSNTNVVPVGNPATWALIGPDDTFFVNVSSGSSQWVHLGTWVFPADGNGHSVGLEFNSGAGFSTGAPSQSTTDITIRHSLLLNVLSRN